MHEELSRLLAGELDAATEAELWSRIATDPALADAWARMLALPDLLAALPVEAPPAALVDRLYAMTPTDAPAPDLDALGLGPSAPAPDPAAFSPDRLEDTIDPEPRAARPGAPTRLSAHRAAIGRSRAASPPRAAPARRRAWAAAGVVALALAVGAGVGASAPRAPATVGVADGASVVDGEARIRAGGLEVHVDGRARVTVTEAPTARAPAPAGGGRLVAVGAEPLPAPARTSTGTRAAAPGAVPAAGVGAAVLPEGGPRAEGGAALASASSSRTNGAAVLVGGVPSEGRTFVTVEVERGSATVAVEGGGGAVRVAAGETRRFTAPVPADGPSRPEASDPERELEVPGVRIDEAVAGRELPFELAGADRIVAAVDAHVASWPSALGAEWEPSEVERLLWDLETPGAALVALDCDAWPCAAAFASLEPGALTELRETLADSFPADVAALVFVEDAGVVSVAVAPHTVRTAARYDAAALVDAAGALLDPVLLGAVGEPDDPERGAAGHRDGAPDDAGGRGKVEE